MGSSVLFEKLSIIVISWSFLNSLSVVCIPINPVPPVTNIFIFFLMALCWGWRDEWVDKNWCLYYFGCC